MTEEPLLASVRRACELAAASRFALATSPDTQRRGAVAAMADAVHRSSESILAENLKDLRAAAGLAPAMLDRLRLDADRLASIVADLRRVADLPDPLAETLGAQTLPNGLQLRRQRVPVGTLGVVYEARPNVTTDLAALAIRSGNALVLRGGKETRHSNSALLACVRQGLYKAGLPAAAVQALPAEDRSEIDQLLQLHRHIDLLIPRGGQALQDHCRRHAQMAVVFGGIGICHLYWATSALLEPALAVVENAKVQRPTVCNSLDTLLLQRERAADVLPQLHARLHPLGVTLVLDSDSVQLLGADCPGTRPAMVQDYDREWLSLQLGVRLVDDMQQAIDHIREHGTAHSDGILSEDADQAASFLQQVDSAAVYWNASTRFTDGSAFGLGAEVAVSTQRLHARGPMGLEALTTYKWVAVGNYHVRA